MEKKNLLIFESDPDFSAALKSTFSEYGFNVLTARTESNVQEQLGLDRMDFFIIRAENPYISGFLLCKKIREMSEYKETPILLLSSEADDAVFAKHRSFPFAANYYLTLPRDIEEVLAVAHTLFPFLGELEEEEEIEVTPDIHPAAEEESSAVHTEELEHAVLALTSENESLNQKIEQLQALVEKSREGGEADETLLLEKEEIEKRLEESTTEINELKDAVAGKARQVESLQQRVEELEEITESASVETGTVDSLKLEIGNLRKGRDEAIKQNARHEEEIELLKAKIETIEMEKRELAEREASPALDGDSTLMELQDENEDLKIINKGMKEKVREIERKIQETLHETEEKMVSMEKKMEDAFGRKNDAEAEKERIEEENLTLVERVEKAEAELESSRIESGNLMRRIEEMEGKIAALQSETIEKSEKISELEEKTAELSGEAEKAEALRNRLQALDEEKVHLEEMFGEKEQELVQLQGQQGELRVTIQNLTEDVTLLGKEKGEMESALANTKEEISSLTERLSERNTVVENLTNQLEEKSIEAMGLNERIEKIESEIHEKNIHSEKLQHDNSMMKDVINKIKENLAGMEI